MSDLLRSVAKSISTEIKSSIDVDVELASFSQNGMMVEADLVGKKEFKTDEEVKEAGKQAEAYIKKIDPEALTEMVKKYGDI